METIVDTRSQASQRPPLLKRLLYRLFPARLVPPPPPTEGFYNEDYLRTEGLVVFSWPDRIRMLISGRMALVVNTRTDVKCERSVTTAGVYVVAPSFSKRG